MTKPTDQMILHFSRGIPPLEAIPSHELAKQTTISMEEARDGVFQYAPIGQFQGAPALRQQLGMFHNTNPNDIFVGNGSLQVLDLVTQHLLRASNKVVYVEAPTYDRAVKIFERHGGRIVGLPIEGDGLDVGALKKHLRSQVPAFLYTVPDFQNPSGVTMSEEKRRVVIDLAATYGFTIIEDIPYRELRYHGASPPLLREISGETRVISIGSLSKILSPGLRIGYAISDQEISTAIALLAENTYLSPAPLCQAVAAGCLATGIVQSNIIKIRELLKPRHDAAVAITRSLFGDALIATPNGGYFLGIHWHINIDEPALLAAARAEKILLTSGSAFYPPPITPPAGKLFLRLPFQSLEPHEFAAGIERLLKISKQVNL